MVTNTSLTPLQQSTVEFLQVGTSAGGPLMVHATKKEGRPAGQKSYRYYEDPAKDLKDPLVQSDIASFVGRSPLVCWHPNGGIQGLRGNPPDIYKANCHLKREITHIRGLFCEADAKDPINKDANGKPLNLPDDVMDAMFERVKAVITQEWAVKPTMMVRSRKGGGFHIYYIFDEPFVMPPHPIKDADDENFTEEQQNIIELRRTITETFEKANKSLALRVSSIVREQERIMDPRPTMDFKVTTLDRKFRLPGAFKGLATPEERNAIATLEYCNPENKYSPEALISAFDDNGQIKSLLLDGGGSPWLSAFDSYDDIKSDGFAVLKYALRQLIQSGSVAQNALYKFQRRYGWDPQMNDEQPIDFEVPYSEGFQDIQPIAILLEQPSKLKDLHSDIDNENPQKLIRTILKAAQGITYGVKEPPEQPIAAAEPGQPDPALLDKMKEMDSQYIFITNFGGKARILDLRAFTTAINGKAKPVIAPQALEEWRKQFLNQTHMYNGRPITIGNYWLTVYQDRKQYLFAEFIPGRKTPENVYNLWQGWAYEAKEGNNHESFLAHIKDNLCDSDNELYEYCIKWMANCIQNPAGPGGSALVFKGGKGSGKTFFAERFGELFGRHYLMVSDSRHVVGNFNSHLQDKILLLADEALFAGDKKTESTLKTLITSPTIPIEYKGVNVVDSLNCVHMIMCSNEDWVVPATHDERRYCVSEVNSQQTGNREYFGKIAKDLEEGGYENLMYFLKNLDLKGWDANKAPKSRALKDQKEMSQDCVTSYAQQRLELGMFTEETPWSDKVPPITKHSIYQHFMLDTRGQPGGNKPGNYNTFFKRFKAAVGGKGLRNYKFPTLDEARKYFAEVHLDEPDYEWPDPVQTGSVEELASDSVSLPQSQTEKEEAENNA